MQLRQCAYCLKQKPFHKSKKLRTAYFTREHVIPEAICGFADELTIIGHVCADCNSFFSKNHDVWLTRSSMVGTDRYRYRQKSLTLLHELNDELTNVLIVLGDKKTKVRGKYSNLHGRLAADAEPVYLVVHGADDSTTALSVEDIETNQQLHALLSDAAQVDILSSSQVGVDKLVEALSNRGVKVGQLQSLEQYDEAPAEVAEEFIFDWNTLRAYAKVAFNYFVYVCAARNSEAFLNQEFDAIRSFILEGKHPGFHPVLPERANVKLSVNDIGHFIACHNAQGIHPTTAGRTKLFVIISIYGRPCWNVCLTEHLSDTGHGLGNAHFWSLRQKRCYCLRLRHRQNSLIESLARGSDKS